MYAFIFPGQGSQFVGMGKDLAAAFPAAKEVFQEVDEALGQNLSKLMFDGPEEDLNLTENTQPALMAVSIAVVRVLKTGRDDILTPHTTSYVAGHSLGEYSALTATGMFKLTDAAKLLKTRGQEMQKAVPVGKGAMTAILGLDLADVAEIIREAARGETLTIANDNSPGQVVISGDKTAVERANALATAKGAKRVVPLTVSAPFHCPLMKPAADAMEEALKNVDVLTPAVPLIANVIAEEVQDPEKIRRLLVEQVTGMVRWRESIQYIAGRGIHDMVEIGAGKVLTGLGRRIDKEIKGCGLGTPQDIDDFLSSL